METNTNNYKRKFTVLAATLALHLLLVFILWQSVLKTPVSSWAQTIQNSDTLFLELNTNKVIKGDGFGCDVNTAGTPTAFTNFNNSNHSTTQQSSESFLSENIVNSNITTLNTEKVFINPKSLFDKSTIKTSNNTNNTTDGIVKGDPNKNKIGVYDGTETEGNVSLKGRTLIEMPALNYKSNINGKIIIRIWVDKSGKVVRATEGNGSTIVSETLKNIAINTALKTQYNADNTANELQEGRIIFNFKSSK